MENLNLHKQKLYALILAGVALVAIILPWMTVSVNFGGYGGGSRSVNGFRGWGYLSLLGIAAVAVATFMEDKTKEYMGNMKMVAMGGFGAIAVGAIVFFIRISQVGGGGYQGVKSSAGFGLFIEIAAGVLGLLWIMGLVKAPQKPASPPPPKA